MVQETRIWIATVGVLMAFAQDQLALLHAVRARPGEMGLRPHRVELREAESAGPHTGDGETYESWTNITEAGGYPPKVRWMKDEEIAVGALPSGSIEIGPITTELGAKIALLRGDDLTNGQMHMLRITGPMHPNGALYTIKSVMADHAMHYTLRAFPLSESPT